jgi:ArsR family transcriptional regulator
VACEARCVDPEGTEVARAAVGNLELRNAAPLIAALGDLTRLRLVSALLTGPLCTCDLASVLGVSDSAVSHQLRLLKDLHLVESRRDGRIVYHELTGPHVRRFVENVCEGAREVRTAR